LRPRPGASKSPSNPPDSNRLDQSETVFRDGRGVSHFSLGTPIRTQQDNSGTECIPLRGGCGTDSPLEFGPFLRSQLDRRDRACHASVWHGWDHLYNLF